MLDDRESYNNGGLMSWAWPNFELQEHLYKIDAWPNISTCYARPKRKSFWRVLEALRSNFGAANHIRGDVRKIVTWIKLHLFYIQKWLTWRLSIAVFWRYWIKILTRISAVLRLLRDLLSSVSVGKYRIGTSKYVMGLSYHMPSNLLHTDTVRFGAVYI
jgi:hypothetical protein